MEAALDNTKRWGLFGDPPPTVMLCFCLCRNGCGQHNLRLQYCQFNPEQMWLRPVSAHGLTTTQATFFLSFILIVCYFSFQLLLLINSQKKGLSSLLDLIAMEGRNHYRRLERLYMTCKEFLPGNTDNDYKMS